MSDIDFIDKGGWEVIAGNDKEVQFNDGGFFGANSLFVFDKGAVRLGVGTTVLDEVLNLGGTNPVIKVTDSSTSSSGKVGLIDGTNLGLQSDGIIKAHSNVEPDVNNVRNLGDASSRWYDVFVGHNIKAEYGIVDAKSFNVRNTLTIMGTPANHFVNYGEIDTSLASSSDSLLDFSNIGKTDLQTLQVRDKAQVLNKAEDDWITFAEKDTTGTESVVNLSNVKSVNFKNNTYNTSASAALELYDLVLRSPNCIINRGDVFPYYNNTYNIGSGTMRFKDIFLSGKVDVTGTNPIIKSANSSIGTYAELKDTSSYDYRPTATLKLGNGGTVSEARFTIFPDAPTSAVKPVTLKLQTAISDATTEVKQLDLYQGATAKIKLSSKYGSDVGTDFSIQDGSKAYPYMFIQQATDRIGFGTNSPSAEVNYKSGNADIRWTKGSGGITPSISVINTSGKAVAFSTDAYNSGVIFDQTGSFTISPYAHADIDANTFTPSAHKKFIMNMNGITAIGSSPTIDTGYVLSLNSTSDGASSVGGIKYDTPQYEDINIAVTELAGQNIFGAVNAYITFGEYSSGVVAIFKQSTTDNFRAKFNTKIPHAYAVGNDIELYINLIQHDTATDIVQLKLTYQWANSNGVLSAAQTLLKTYTLEGTTDKNIEIDMGTIAGTGIDINSTLLCTIERIADANDTYAGDAYISGISCRIPVDTVGSRQATIK